MVDNFRFLAACLIADFNSSDLVESKIITDPFNTKFFTTFMIFLHTKSETFAVELLENPEILCIVLETHRICRHFSWKCRRQRF